MASTPLGLSLREGPLADAGRPHSRLRLARPPLASPFSLRRIVMVCSLLLLSMAAMFAFSGPAHAQSFVGPKAYYLDLGNSLAFGYQPDLDWAHGYGTDFANNLKNHGSQNYINMACPGETTGTFINGGCPYAALKKYIYFTPQLQAAVSFINSHPGQVSPVTLDIGANDLLPDINSSNCTVSSTWTTDLATMKTNLGTILSQLKGALHGTGDLLLMNYYDPYQNQCPSSVPYVQQINSAIASVAGGYSVPVANVFNAFGGATVPDPNTCNYTWICNFLFHDIHATDAGYSVIASTFESLYGY